MKKILANDIYPDIVIRDKIIEDLKSLNSNKNPILSSLLLLAYVVFVVFIFPLINIDFSKINPSYIWVLGFFVYLYFETKEKAILHKRIDLLQKLLELKNNENSEDTHT